jgi:hypothetical protein
MGQSPRAKQRHQLQKSPVVRLLFEGPNHEIHDAVRVQIEEADQRPDLFHLRNFIHMVRRVHDVITKILWQHHEPAEVSDVVVHASSPRKGTKERGSERKRKNKQKSRSSSFICRSVMRILQAFFTLWPFPLGFHTFAISPGISTFEPCAHRTQACSRKHEQ